MTYAHALQLYFYIELKIADINTDNQVIRIKSKDTSGEMAGFLRRNCYFLQETLEVVHPSLREEIGELLPQHFKFLYDGVPVKANQGQVMLISDTIAQNPEGKELGFS